MTYQELCDLTMNGTHKTIGNVRLTIHEEERYKRWNEIRVTYKSGRKFEYRKKEQLPKTVLDFLNQQNKHIAYGFDRGLGNKGIIVYYFCVPDAACATESEVLK